MKDELTLARGWFLKARSDLATARRTLDSKGPYDTACFHAQQACEKYLKGFLAANGFQVPRTHDLEELQRLCVQIKKTVGLEELLLFRLSGYAVEMRYDLEFWPDIETAREAVTLAERVEGIILSGVPKQARPEE